MNKRLVLWFAASIFTLALALAGCQKKEEPTPAANPAPATPAAGAPTGAGAVAPAPPGGEAIPGTPAATAETKSAEKKEEGKKKF